jgi:hypothetical protein
VYPLDTIERQDPAVALTSALLSASQNHSPTDAQRQTMRINNPTALRLGIMLPRDPDRPAEVTRISWINTPEQLAGRDSLWRLLSDDPHIEIDHPGMIPLATRLDLSELRSAIIGRGTPRLAAYDDHLRRARIALSEATARGDVTEAGAWDPPGAVDENGDPYTLEGIYRHLRRITHNTIILAMVSPQIHKFMNRHCLYCYSL